MKNFSSNYADALTMLYLQNHDVSGMTPAELNALYWKTRREILLDYEQNSQKYEMRYDSK